jgi:TolB-like protein/Tfp pilus assembly protein PilF
MSILRELQQRKVIRVAGVYIVVAWLLVQIAATIAPILGLPDWFEKLVLALLGMGFPVALILAWAFELTPDGIRRGSSPSSSRVSAYLDYVILGGAVLVAAYLLSQPSMSPEQDRRNLDRSVAVLPFLNLDGDGATVAFAAGIHSDLCGQLSRISSLRTISRTSMRRYQKSDLSVPEIAKELDVATVLEGSVQRSGDNVRISVQLIDATADEPLWTETYDRELTAANLFAIQSEIARAIGHQLQVALSSDDLRRLDTIPTHSIAALESYFIGKLMLEQRTNRSLMAAIDYFEAVVELDPNFALGWSGLADAYMLLPEYSYTFDSDLLQRRAREAVLKALSLDPGLPEVRATEAWYQLRFFDWVSAEQAFREALAVAPDNTNALHWLSHTLSWQGQHEEAIELARRAVEADPQSKMMRTNLAYILNDARRFDEGLELARQLREIDPDYTIQHRSYYLHNLWAGRSVAAADTFAGYVETVGGDRAAAQRIGEMWIAYAERGEAHEVPGDLTAAALVGNDDLGQVLAFAGDAEGAINALQVAVAEQSGSRAVFNMKINPGYDFIRQDPRFIALLEEVGLAD